jgi:hypothetical protein
VAPDDPPLELAADQRAGAQDFARPDLAARGQQRQAGGNGGAGGRTVDLAGADGNGVLRLPPVGNGGQGPAKRQKEKCRQSGFSGW